MATEHSMIKVTNNEIESLVYQIDKHEESVDYTNHEMHLDLSNYGSARPQVLVTLSSYILDIKKKSPNGDIHGTIITPDNPDVEKYMNRMGFFDITGTDITYNYSKHEPGGRFIEVKKFDKDNQDEIIGELTDCLQRFEVSQDMQRAMIFTFSELLDNAVSHSYSPIGGVISAQKYYDRLEIAIADRGVGIAYGIANSEMYMGRHYSHQEALRVSVQENISTKLHDETRGHQGFGLFAINEIVKHSGGSLKIISNDVKLETQFGTTRVTEFGSNWQGTIIQITLRPADTRTWELIWRDIFESRGHESPWLVHIDDLF